MKDTEHNFLKSGSLFIERDKTLIDIEARNFNDAVLLSSPKPGPQILKNIVYIRWAFAKT